MGFQSTIMILNDAMEEIDKDPKGWWQKTKSLITRHNGTKSPEEYGFGTHGNGFTLVDVHHADNTSVIAVGGNHASLLTRLSKHPHHDEKGQIELLKALAKEHGYRLVKESK
jgi:hypothetical protein